jgi:DNA-directed RNA polymerase specialized sigma24 family protein
MPFENGRLYEIRASAEAPPAITGPAAEADPMALWNQIAAALRRGDPGAHERFASAYANGARILFRRRVGSVRAEQMVADALAGAAGEIRLGWIQTPRDLVFFLRSLCQPDSGSADPFAAVDSAADVARVRLTAARLEELLGRLPAAERMAVRLCYLDRKPFPEAVAEAGLSDREGQRLRQRLQLAFHTPAEERDPAPLPVAAPLRRATAPGR